MSDNLFDRLFELFQTTDRVNWRLAEEITKSVAGAVEPIEPQLAEEYEELALAAHLVLAEEDLVDTVSAIIPHPIDRAGWAAANHRSFRYLVEPLADALGGSRAGADPAAAMMAPLGPALMGMQAGSMSGFLSGSVLGQFDLALPPLDQDGAFLVVPNVEAFAAAGGLDRRQVRMWATLHELTHASLTGNKALRDHVTALVSDIVAAIDFDPGRLMERLSALQDPSQIEGMMSESDGLAVLFGEHRDEAAAGKLVAAAAVIEALGDYTVRSAGGRLLPDLPDIERAHRARRERENDGNDQLGGLLGIEVRRSRANDAADLLFEIDRRWGPEAVAGLRSDPGRFPTLDELTDPVGWAARALLD
jgi:putative hydrolase